MYIVLIMGLRKNRRRRTRTCVSKNSEDHDSNLKLIFEFQSRSPPLYSSESTSIPSLSRSNAPALLDVFVIANLITKRLKQVIEIDSLHHESTAISNRVPRPTSLILRQSKPSIYQTISCGRSPFRKLKELAR